MTDGRIKSFLKVGWPHVLYFFSISSLACHESQVPNPADSAAPLATRRWKSRGGTTHRSGRKTKLLRDLGHRASGKVCHWRLYSPPTLEIYFWVDKGCSCLSRCISRPFPPPFLNPCDLGAHPPALEILRRVSEVRKLYFTHSESSTRFRGVRRQAQVSRRRRGRDVHIW